MLSTMRRSRPKAQRAAPAFTRAPVRQRLGAAPITRPVRYQPFYRAGLDSDPNSTDPRDFRAFIEEHKSGLLVRKARHKLEDLADEAFAAAGGDKAALERFPRVHFDSVKVEAARAVLAEAEERRQAGEQRRREEAARQAEDKRCREEEEARRIRVGAPISVPAGLERFLPGAGKTEWFKNS